MLRNRVSLTLAAASGQAFGGNMRRRALVVSNSSPNQAVVGLGYAPTATNFDFNVTNATPLILSHNDIGDSITEAVFVFVPGSSITISVTEFFTP